MSERWRKPTVPDLRLKLPAKAASLATNHGALELAGCTQAAGIFALAGNPSSGIVAVPGVTLAVADAALVPAALVALTVHAYVVPLLKPVTVMGELERVAVKFPGVQVTV